MIHHRDVECKIRMGRARNLPRDLPKNLPGNFLKETILLTLGAKTKKQERPTQRKKSGMKCSLDRAIERGTFLGGRGHSEPART